jgi:hypothetical protein
VKGPELLRENVGRIASSMGAAFLGSHTIFRGQDLHAQLGGARWLDLYLFGITGRRFSAPQLQLLEAVWTHTSYPDARIWNNRVAALAGTARSTGGLGLAAALAVSEADIYGLGPGTHAIDFLYRARAAIDVGGDLEGIVLQELDVRRSIGGYGRPISSLPDERIAPLLGLAKSLGLADGPYLKLAFDVEKFLLEGRYRMRMNYASFIAGLSADIGLTQREHYFFLFPLFLAGMVPCYIEASERPEATFLPLPCDAVAYKGSPKRKWNKP